jgi:hypothetical protein
MTSVLTGSVPMLCVSCVTGPLHVPHRRVLKTKSGHPRDRERNIDRRAMPRTGTDRFAHGASDGFPAGA